MSQFGKRLLDNNSAEPSDDVDDNDEDDAEAAEEADGAHKAADSAIIEALDGEDLSIELTTADIGLPSDALAKVRPVAV